MSFCTLLPRALTACAVLCLSATVVTAQTEAVRPRRVTTTTTTTLTTTATQVDNLSRLENEPVVISTAPLEEEVLNDSLVQPASRATHLQQMLQAAIEMRIGTPYRLGATGPTRYDCSGFVWSVFQSAGIDFERSNARSLWRSFAPAREDEKLKFGTLVFFNHLNHIGIVADENGFYHASTSKGVTYSPFNEYWLARVDGFRRVPVSEMEMVASVIP